MDSTGHDVEIIIDQVRTANPSLKVVQHSPSHEADDDGLWWFSLPGNAKDIQIESSSYNCPFMIEHSDMKSTSEALTGRSIDEVVQIVCDYLKSL